jgi:hypothetical protein
VLEARHPTPPAVCLVTSLTGHALAVGLKAQVKKSAPVRWLGDQFLKKTDRVPLGRRTRKVRSLNLIDALSEIDRRTRDSNVPSVHHVDAVGDCQSLVDVLLDHQHARAVIGCGT